MTREPSVPSHHAGAAAGGQVPEPAGFGTAAAAFELRGAMPVGLGRRARRFGG